MTEIKNLLNIAHWIHVIGMDSELNRCSACNCYFRLDLDVIGQFNYCPHCGSQIEPRIEYRRAQDNR